jgi:transposase
MQPGAALSVDLRSRIVAAWQTKRHTYPQLAELFGVGEATVSRLLRLFRETGSVEPRPHGGGAPRRLTPRDLERLKLLVERNPDWTTHELADALTELLGAPVSRSTVHRELRRMGYTPKKSPWSPKSATRSASRSGGSGTKKSSRRSPLRVWFLWTKPARTSR